MRVLSCAFQMLRNANGSDGLKWPDHWVFESRISADLKGFRVVLEWSSDCTHLVTTRRIPTQKTMFAMLSLAWIVLPSWIDKCFEVASQFPTVSSMPDPLHHLPPTSDVSFDDRLWVPNVERKILFKHIVFLLTDSHQINSIGGFISLAGTTTL